MHSRRLPNQGTTHLFLLLLLIHVLVKVGAVKDTGGGGGGGKIKFLETTSTVGDSHKSGGGLDYLSSFQPSKPDLFTPSSSSSGNKREELKSSESRFKPHPSSFLPTHQIQEGEELDTGAASSRSILLGGGALCPHQPCCHHQPHPQPHFHHHGGGGWRAPPIIRPPIIPHPPIRPPIQPHPSFGWESVKPGSCHTHHHHHLKSPLAWLGGKLWGGGGDKGVGGGWGAGLWEPPSHNAGYHFYRRKDDFHQVGGAGGWGWVGEGRLFGKIKTGGWPPHFHSCHSDHHCPGVEKCCEGVCRVPKGGLLWRRRR